MNTSRFFLLISFLLFFGAKAMAQDYNVELFDIKKGLSHNTVYDIVQDHFGYMWIGTQNGLNRYDGYNTTLIAEKQQNELSKEFKGKCITAVFLDSKNNLWAGARMGFVNIKYASNNSFKNLTSEYFNQKTQGHEISRFYEDSKGNVWIATVGSGLFKVEYKTDSIHHFSRENSNLSSNDVFDILESNNKIIVACGGGNLNLLQNGSFVQTHEMRGNSPNLSGYRKRLVEANGYIWLGTQGTGLYRINPKSLEFLNFNLFEDLYDFKANVVKDIISLNDSTLYIATDGNGVYKLNSITSKFSKIEQDDFGNILFNSLAFNCFAKDFQNNLWIGSYNGGVNILKNTPKVFHLKSPKTTKTVSTSILSIAPHDNEHLLLGTDGEGLMLYNTNNGDFNAVKTCENNIAAPTVVKSILKLDNGNYLIGCFSEGLFHYDRESYCFSKISSLLNIWSIKKGPKGHYWLGCLGSGIIELDENFIEVENSLNPISNSGNVMDFEFDNRGNLWLGTGNEGLYMYDFSNNRLSSVNDSYNEIGKEIRSLKSLNQEYTIVGTEGNGILLFKGTELIDYWDLEKGLLTNDAVGFTQLIEEKLWISSFKGISSLNLQTKEVKNFSLNGIESGNQLNQNAIYLSNDNTLYLGGIYGLTRMSIKDLYANNFSSKSYISELNVQGLSVQQALRTREPTEELSSIELSHNQNSIHLTFFAPNLLQSENRIINYQLIGADEKVRTTNPGENEVEYTNISPGSYELKFGYEGQISTLNITVNSPYWEQSWFRMMLFFAILGIVGIGFQVALSKQNEKHKQELLAYKNKELEEELETKNSRLMYSAVQNASKNEILNELKSQLMVVKSQTENEGLKKVLRTLNRELKNENYWSTFNTYFNDVDTKFINDFKNKHGELTQNDQRLVALIRLNLSTNEIASLLNISVRGVEQSKYRLKKKLALEKEQNLVSYIQNL
ncbi:MAG: hypothetical protein JXQ87_01430 [Bacteroidia bacterium]